MTPPDTCPKCMAQLASPSDTCPKCGVQPVTEPAVEESRPAKESGISGLIEMDYSVAGEDDKPELPQWRVDLSRRFQEIKSKRQSGTGSAGEPAGQNPSPPAAIQPAVQKPGWTDPARQPVTSEPAPVAPPAAARRPRPMKPPSRPEIKVSQPPVPAMPLFQPPAPQRPSPDVRPSGSTATPAATIQEMIDRAVAHQAAPAASPALASASSDFPKPEPQLESRLILLSRTLSGLVDLIIVVFCAGALVITADSVSGIETLDTRSIANYAALLLAVFFLYSGFFLFTGSQTVGMMITDLRLVDFDELRPGIAQILGRSALFLVSLLVGGLGLLWGCFDKEARCLHDRYSHTKIVHLVA